MRLISGQAATAVCPTCGKAIGIVFVWEPGEIEAGIFPGWIPGIAIEDEACANHMTWDQRQAIEDAALAEAPANDPEGAMAHGG